MRRLLLPLVLVAFAATAIVLAEAPVTAPATSTATQPSTRAAARAAAIKKDLKNFRLCLDYFGEEPKPYYRLVLQVAQIADMEVKWDAQYPHVQITEDQARKIVDYLAAEGFLDRADPPRLSHLPPAPPQGPVYVLSAADYTENLGWGLPMLQRLDGLRTVLDGDAGKKMDLLIARMSGHREEWIKKAAK